jgi:hypothetical protein
MKWILVKKVATIGNKKSRKDFLTASKDLVIKN